MKTVFTILLLGCVFFAFPQAPKIYFDDAITEHLKGFNAQCDLAVKNKEMEQVNVLFDSLMKKHLKGTFVSDIKVRKINGGYLETSDIKTPLLLIMKKTCFVQSWAEIKAINEMAAQYEGKVKFVVLYWDKKRLAKKAVKSYNKNIALVYVNERDNKLNTTLSSLKNSFGVPACFYMTQDRQISSIDRKFYLKNIKSRTKKEFVENTYEDITQLLLENENKRKESVISISN